MNKNKSVEKYTIASIWIMLFLVLYIQILPQTISILEATIFPIIILLLAYPITTFLSGPLLRKCMKQGKMVLFVFYFLLFSVIIGLFFYGMLLFFSYLERKEIFPESDYFNMDMPIYMVLVPISAGLAINICICGIRFYLENLKLNKTIIEYQIETLEKQISPHFMFNILNHINTLILEDANLASELLIQYSSILRYQLYYGGEKKVTISQDIQFLQDYIALEEIRWNDKIVVEATWDIQDGNKEIPPLLFISFLENAFKYVSKSEIDKGHIIIFFQQKGNIINLKVSNSKTEFKEINKSPGIGLKNIKERLEILFIQKYKLDIQDSDKEFKINLLIYIA